MAVCGTVTGALSSCHAPADRIEGVHQLNENVLLSSVTAMARAIADGEVSSEEITKACLERIDDVNPLLNAVVQLAAERALLEAREADAALARGESRGALHGVPITIKDSLDTEGIVSAAGTLGRADFAPETDATVVIRLREAGAILLGKTNTPELTLAPQTDNLVYGRTNNPYDLERTPGGSSGGAAAIVAAGGSALDIGSDTGGSIRVPAHFNGIAGIKPTSGRVPRTGHVIGFEDALEALTTLGPLARYVEDLETILRLISGPDGKDAAIVPAELRESRYVDLGSLRLAFYVDDGTESSTEATIAVVRKAAKELSPHVATVEERRPTPLEQSGELMARLFEADGGARIQRTLDKAGTESVHPWLARFLDRRAEKSATEAYKAIESWATYRSEMLAFFDDFDVILCPVVGHAAPHHVEPGQVPDERGWYTMAYNLTGWPVAVVRAGSSPIGLPIGLQVVAPPWREDIALAIAGELESMFGGYQAPSL